jgi:hypothetical protein
VIGACILIRLPSPARPAGLGQSGGWPEGGKCRRAWGPPSSHRRSRLRVRTSRDDTGG